MTHLFYSIPHEQEHVMTNRRLTRTVPRLRELREARLLSQNMLAGRAGITRPTVQRIEYGHSADASTIHKLARALDVTPEELVMRSEEARS
jgi:transcriptional regulator with XRE-family HTH domain